MRRLTALSGFDAKGPACFLLEIDRRRLLLDLGEGPDYRARPDLRGVGRVDAILVSHGHADHAGALDLASQVGNPPIHCDPAARWTSPMLAGARTFAEADGVETGAAGHAPGAVWMRIGGPEGLLYTGDMVRGGAYAWHSPPAAAALLVDASYGVNAEQLDPQRADMLVLTASGPLLLPAPPHGRGVEMALACLEAGHDIALCAEQVVAIKAMLEWPKTLADGIAGRLDDLLGRAHSAEGADVPFDGVTVAAGANAGSGLSAALAPAFIEAGATVLFTGHLSAGAPSKAWVESGAALWRRWNVHPDAGLLAKLLANAPRIAMPAFVEATGRREVAAAHPDIRFADGPVMEW